ncbi:hypothetical protein Dcar01_01789 [Deinococcus carri]|uniref:DUF4386 domain-containing protein n=1 Tax=Deinococcus carri TaxID=1211323 RepID=A0ABP9W955_9DEIO
MTQLSPASAPVRHRSPHPGMVAAVFVTLFMASIAASALLSRGAPYPTPYLPLSQLQDYYARYPDALRVAAFLQFGASVPLAILAATLVDRLRFHGIRVAGTEIAHSGGVAASVFLALSALSTWALTQPDVVSDVGALRTLQLLGFATGGFAHATGLGLLLAGVSVPWLVFGLGPRWVAWTGLAIALTAMLSSLSLLFPSLSVLLPLARFPAYLWLIAAGWTLPAVRDGAP